MQLIIHTPTIINNRIIATYTHNQVTYTHEFITPTSIPLDDSNITTIVQWLSIIHAVYLFTIEYFDEIATEFDLSDKEITFFEKIIYNGMAEFRYINNIPINMMTRIIPSSFLNLKATVNTSKKLDGRLLLNGGGKDGLTSAILMNKAQIEYDLFQIGTGIAQSRTSKSLNKKSFIFTRVMDKRQFKQRYTGHKPTSAAIAISATLCAYLLGKNEVIASNENSANEPNLEINGVNINHQYSKTYEFENDFSSLLRYKGIDIKYFSLLRPLHELQIVKIFSSEPTYHTSFISCNNGFRKGHWCMKCAKCAFMNLIILAISPATAQRVFQTSNNINSFDLYAHIASLIEPQTVKPFECVGSLIECQIAAKLILNNPDIELSEQLQTLFSKYTQDITDDIIKKFIISFQPAHNIPRPEYDNLLEIMRSSINI